MGEYSNSAFWDRIEREKLREKKANIKPVIMDEERAIRAKREEERKMRFALSRMGENQKKAKLSQLRTHDLRRWL